MTSRHRHPRGPAEPGFATGQPEQGAGQDGQQAHGQRQNFGAGHRTDRPQAHGHHQQEQAAQHGQERPRDLRGPAGQCQRRRTGPAHQQGHDTGRGAQGERVDPGEGQEKKNAGCFQGAGMGGVLADVRRHASEYLRGKFVR